MPYPAVHKYGTVLDLAIMPETKKDQEKLSKEMHINYRQVTGTFIWPMIKAHPDIYFHTTKLSKFMANPAHQHCKAIRQVGEYIAKTLGDGIYFWQETP